MPKTARPAAGCWPACSVKMASAPALAAVLGDVLWCLGLGLLLGFGRDLTGLVLGEGPVRCFLWDVAAFAAAAVLLYGFCAGVSASGVARWYMAGAMLAGALAWRGAFRRALYRAAAGALRLAVQPFRVVRRILVHPLEKRAAAAFAGHRERARVKRDQKKAKKRKKQLQKSSKVLYN